MQRNIASPSAQPIHWIRTLLLVEEAANMGVPHAVSLAGTRITPERFSELDVTITLQDEMRIMINVARALPDQPIGLQWGKTLDIFSYQSVGLWASAHENLGELVSAMVRYQALLNAVVTGCIRKMKDVYWLELIYPPLARPNSSLVRINNESMVTNFLQIFRQLQGANLNPVSVHFCHEQPVYASEYETLFKCPVHFNADTTRMVCKAADVDKPLASHHPAVKRVHTRLIEHEYENFVAQNSLADLIRLQLRSRPEQTPTAAPIADSLGISERTLRRRLETEGTSFRELHKEILMESARTLLAQGVTVDATAQRLGYAEASSFRRALKRLCGLSPSELRKNQQQQTPLT